MVDRPALRLIDAGFAAAIALVAIYAMHSCKPTIPDLPAGVCANTAPATRTPLVDGRLAIGAVFAVIDDDHDVTGWSSSTFTRELELRGFRRVSPARFERADAVVDLVAPVPDDVGDVQQALDGALASHAVVYYNGHNFGGELELVPHGPQQILVLDTCWSAQYYGDLAPRVALVANTERAITGSVFSFLGLLDGLLARDGRSWATLLAEMNAEARIRARLRPDSPYPEPERYALVTVCGS